MIKEIINGRPCWERLDDENGKAWEAFQHYRDQGPKRTFAEVARFLDVARLTDVHQRLRERFARMGMPVPPELSVEQIELRVQRGRRGRRSSTSRIHYWAKLYHWHDRAVWYDRHLDKVRQAAAAAEVESMVRRHISLSGLLQNKAAERLQALDAQELTPKNVLDYIEIGMKLERLTREMATDHRKVETSDPESESNAREMLKRRLEIIANAKKSTPVLDEVIPPPSSRGVVEILQELAETED